MNTTPNTKPLLGMYRLGRDRYDLSATDAIAYARNVHTLRGRDDVYVAAEPDPDDDGLILIVCDWETDVILDTMGGVDIDFTVSDHGNLHYDDMNPYVVELVAGMVA